MMFTLLFPKMSKDVCINHIIPYQLNDKTIRINPTSHSVQLGDVDIHICLAASNYEYCYCISLHMHASITL